MIPDRNSYLQEEMMSKLLKTKIYNLYSSQNFLKDYVLKLSA